MTQQSLRQAWSAIDQAADPDYFVRFMDYAGRQDEAPGQYAGTFDLLRVRQGDRVLDVGCGTCGPARVMALRVGPSGRVVGVDNSKAMIEEANRRNQEVPLPIEAHVADAHQLPFPDASFDACYSMGVFELVGDPLQVLAEMVRVTRPGGGILATGSDADTWIVDTDDREVTRAIVHFACDHEWNGWIGRQLPAAFKAHGLQQIVVSPNVGVVGSLEVVKDLWLGNHLQRVRAAGLIPAADLDRWLADLELRQQEGRFFSSLTGFTVVARKP